MRLQLGRMKQTFLANLAPEEMQPPMALDVFTKRMGVTSTTVWRWRRDGMLHTINICGRQGRQRQGCCRIQPARGSRGVRQGAQGTGAPRIGASQRDEEESGVRSSEGFRPLKLATIVRAEQLGWTWSKDMAGKARALISPRERFLKFGWFRDCLFGAPSPISSAASPTRPDLPACRPARGHNYQQ